ncbi:hypothetical protein ES703_115265 [subsurface metagenome]
MEEKHAGPPVLERVEAAGVDELPGDYVYQAVPGKFVEKPTVVVVDRGERGGFSVESDELAVPQVFENGGNVLAADKVQAVRPGPGLRRHQGGVGVVAVITIWVLVGGDFQATGPGRFDKRAGLLNRTPVGLADRLEVGNMGGCPRLFADFDGLFHRLDKRIFLVADVSVVYAAVRGDFGD